MTETTQPRPAVLCIGETMVVLATQDEPLGLGVGLRLAHAGAESNVAVGLASLGTPVEWYSRLGDDEPGRIVLDSLHRAGVDTRGVRVDKGAATGLYLKDVEGGAARVHYYRRGSAASRMHPGDAAGLDLGDTAIVHLTGVSAALSPTVLDFLDTVIVQARQHRALVSFDVNHRAALWASQEEAAATLLRLSRTSDVCFVGRDEAERLWATRNADDIRALLGHDNHLVVKDAAGAACAYLPGCDAAEATVAAPVLDIVDAVGAGDAFAAGYLHGLVTGSTTPQSLGLGHAMAGRVIRCRTDTADIADAQDVVAIAQSLAEQATRPGRSSVMDAPAAVFPHDGPRMSERTHLPQPDGVHAAAGQPHSSTHSTHPPWQARCIDLFTDQPLMLILRGMAPPAAVELAERAWDLGVGLVEATVEVDSGFASLEAIVKAGHRRGRLVGAGSVTGLGQLYRASETGAAFTVAPGLDPVTIAASRALGLPHVPGVATPSEVQHALALGCTVVKAFPASVLGVDWVKAVLGPFPGLRIVATGGIGGANAGAFLDAGACTVGVGGALADSEQLPLLAALLERSPVEAELEQSTTQSAREWAEQLGKAGA